MSKIKAARSGTKRDAIITNAAKLFRTKGYRASSMRELADKIGVEAPSLYNHIGSKAELLQAICMQVGDRFTHHLNEITSSNKNATEQLKALMLFHIAMMTSLFDEVYVANHEWKHLEEPHLSHFLKQRRLYEAEMLQLVNDGIQQKEFKNIHPQVAVLTILAALRGLEFWQQHKKDIPASLLETNMVNHLLNGLII